MFTGVGAFEYRNATTTPAPTLFLSQANLTSLSKGTKPGDHSYG